MLEEVTLKEIERILAVTDGMGIHREKVVIPLGTRHPGRVRRRPDGKIEIVVEKDEPFDDWLSGLEEKLRAL